MPILSLQLANLSDSANQELPSSDLPSMKDRGPILPVPKGIRPVLSKHRIEVMSLLIFIYLTHFPKHILAVS